MSLLGTLVVMSWFGVLGLREVARRHGRAAKEPGAEPRGDLPPRVTIAAAEPGTFVAIIAKVVSGETLRAPMTGRICVGFDAVIQSRERFDDTPRDILVRQVRGAPFVIDDGTGTATVDPRGAFIRVQHDVVAPVDVDVRPKIHDLDFRIPPGVRYGAVREGVIQIGAIVVVHGMASGPSGADDDSLYRAAEPVRLALAGAPDRSALVSTLPADRDRARRKRGA